MDGGFYYSQFPPLYRDPLIRVLSVLRCGLRFTVQRHFPALLMQLQDADKGDDCSPWQQQCTGTPGQGLHQAPIKGL